MLIQTSKSLNYGQRKPQQWGPLSAVQYAVRANAEQMGKTVYALFPGWGDEYPTEVVSSQVATPLSSYQPSFGSDGYSFPADTLSAGFLVNNKNIRASVPFSVVVQAKNITATTQRKYLCSGINNYSTQALYIDANNAYFRGQIGAGSPNKILSSVNLSASNQFAVIKPTYNTGNVYVNASRGTNSSSLYGSNTTDFSVGGTSSYNSPGCTIEILTYFGDALTIQELEEFQELPYILLMQVPRPIYFDLGAPSTSIAAIRVFDALVRSSAPYSFIQDARTSAAATALAQVDTHTSTVLQSTQAYDSAFCAALYQAQTADAATSVHSPASTQADTQLPVRLAKEQSFDAENSLSVESQGISDIQVIASSTADAIVDSKIPLGVEDSRFADSYLQARQLLAQMTDTHSAVSARVEALLDSNSRASQVAALDTSCLVSTTCMESHTTDSRASTAFLHIREYAALLVLSKLTESLTDTLTTVLGLATEIRRFDTAVSLSTPHYHTSDAHTATSLAIATLADSRARVASTPTRTNDLATITSVSRINLQDASGVVSESRTDLQDSQAALSLQEQVLLDTGVSIATHGGELVDSCAAESLSVHSYTDTATSLSSLEARLVDTLQIIASKMEELRQFDAVAVASLLQINTGDMHTLVSQAEQSLTDTLGALTSLTTSLFDASLNASQVEIRLLDALASLEPYITILTKFLNYSTPRTFTDASAPRLFVDNAEIRSFIDYAVTSRRS